MKPTRRTQPYRKGKARPPGPTLAAMLRGAPRYRPNPQEARRKLRRLARRRLAVRRARQTRAVK